MNWGYLRLILGILEECYNLLKFLGIKKEAIELPLYVLEKIIKRILTHISISGIITSIYPLGG